MKIIVEYKRGWFTIVLPTLQFIIILFSIPLLVGYLFKNDFLVVLSYIVSFILALVLAVATYSFYEKLASNVRTFGEVDLKGEILTFKIGKGKKQTIDFNQEYIAKIAADEVSTSIDIYTKNYRHNFSVFISNINRNEVLKIFPEKFFFNEIVISPKMGNFGFNLEMSNLETKNFIYILLSTLYRTREKNILFSAYQKFPWNTNPMPKFSYIKIFNSENINTEEQEFLKEIESTMISSPVPYLAITPDYLIGYEMKTFLKDFSDYYFKNKNNIIKKYYIIPLGKVIAEVIGPTLDLKNFLIGKTILTFVSSLAGEVASGKGVYLQNVYHLKISTYDEKGKACDLLFEWLGPGDDNYDEGKYFIRFINRDLIYSVN